MSKKVFISYSHKQGEWVGNSLVPCLRAGGAEVLIDEQFQAGRNLVGQMDALQEQADLSLLVLSPDYLDSANCVHEMEQAIARDSQFLNGKIVPVKRIDFNLPSNLKTPLYVELSDDKNAAQWDKLMQACGAELGASAPNWLHARDEIVRYLQRDVSINLVVPRTQNSSKPKWSELIAHIKKNYLPDLGVVDLQSGANTARHGLVAEMLRACGTTFSVPAEPDDLIVLDNYFKQRSTPAHLALTHFDMVVHRPNYEVNLFAALRHLITDRRKLILLVHSRTNFVELLPTNHPLSSITNLVTVELHGRPWLPKGATP